MECQSYFDDLTAYLDQELPEERRRLLTSHLRTCPRCREELESLAWTSRLAARAAPLELEPRLWNGIYGRIQESRQGRPLLPWLSWGGKSGPSWAAVSTLAAVLLLVVGVVFLWPLYERQVVLQQDFTSFVQERDQWELERHQQGEGAPYSLHHNPFASYRQQIQATNNPFSSE